MKPYELVLTNRSLDDDAIKMTMNNAENAYLKGDYETAVFWYSEVLEINQEKIEAEFGVGVSNMGLENYADASKSFTKVIDHSDNLFIQKAEFYQAGCLLAMDETERARRQLAMIANEANHFYKRDAEKILKRMRR